MIASRVATRAAVSTARPNVQRGQRRGIIDWMTNYPDKVMEHKKIQMAGGTKQGENNPTWLKQPGDVGYFAFGCGLVALGLIQLVPGYYRLATGKGKSD
eukprot:CAMPEP_0116823972 /NCGR_PEP_ID=MMETSP0418-20121206/1138_1 /TAXON_ID=1158023 /ORGANISM="Astrosyne radiata, Strain 13vi08-1A" /LENGTH=98 /DNA_ID=CAMNT_0004452291 /DNA_START=46 /DNA_END=342 /DNA_ORIENTATION=+